MIGDSITDLNTARAAGAPCILMSYGFTPVPAARTGRRCGAGRFRRLARSAAGDWSCFRASQTAVAGALAGLSLTSRDTRSSSTIGMERLDHIVVGAAIHRLHHRFGVALAGQHHHRHGAVRGSALIFDKATMPPPPGICTSRITATGLLARTISSAVAASWVAMTWYCAMPRRVFTRSMMMGSSSAMTMQRCMKEPPKSQACSLPRRRLRLPEISESLLFVAFWDRYNEKLLTFQGESDPIPPVIGGVRVPGSFFRKEFIAAALLAAVGFFALGYGAIRLTPEGSSTAIIWPADAFALCLMLRYARGWRERAVMLAGIFAGDLFSNGLGGSGPVLTLGYSLVNTLELALCLMLIGHRRTLRFPHVRAAALFGLKVGVLPALLGGISAMLVTQLGGAPDAFAAGRNWFCSDVLGFCIIFPIGMTISWRQIEKLKLRQRLPLALGTVSLLVIITLLVFPLRHYPLQFLILPAALILSSQFPHDGRGRSDDHHRRHCAGRAGAAAVLSIRLCASSICSCSWRCAASFVCAPPRC